MLRRPEWRVAVLLAAGHSLYLFAQETGAKSVTARPADPTVFATEQKLALVVGIDAYPEESGLPRLHFAAKDAIALKQAFDAHGYRTDILLNELATKTGVRRRLRDMLARAEADKGIVVFAFSGHGGQGKGPGKEQYLATYEVAADNLEEGLSLKEVQETLSQSAARRKVMFVDACRDMAPPGSKTAYGGPSLGRLESSKGIKILNSTAPGTRSFEDEKFQNGVFTHFLLEALNGKSAGANGLITFDQVSDWVTREVRNYRPTQVPYVAGESTGDFFMAGKIKPETARRALVIGIDEYKGGRLLGAVRDAHNIASALTQAGFRPVEVVDPDAATLAARVAEFVKSLGSEDVALFYFAGRGAISAGDAFMMASDAKVTDETGRVSTRGITIQNKPPEGSIAASRILDAIAGSRTGQTILIFDMCLAGLGPESKLNSRALTKPNSLLLFATQPGQLAHETPAGGVLTVNLVRLMKETGLSTNDIMTRLVGDVLKDSSDAQYPYFIENLNEPFYFAPPSR